MLLALTAELFDGVLLDQMTDAEDAVVQEAAANIPAAVRKRLDTAEKLSDEDRETIIQIARQALEEFQPKPKQTEEFKEDAKRNKTKPKLKVRSRSQTRCA